MENAEKLSELDLLKLQNANMRLEIAAMHAEEAQKDRAAFITDLYARLGLDRTKDAVLADGSIRRAAADPQK